MYMYNRLRINIRKYPPPLLQYVGGGGYVYEKCKEEGGVKVKGRKI
jgi:hypothetical protein